MDKNIEYTDITNINVLITGGEGYIGSSLKTYLTPHVNNIVVYDILSGDNILDVDKLSATLINNKIDIIVHLAALSSVTACNENIDLANSINGNGTKSVLAAMLLSQCKHIIYASTSSVYGESNDKSLLPYVETSLTKPCSSYGKSKLLGETVIEEFYQKFNGNYLIFRMFNVVGRLGSSNISTGYDRLFGALESGSVTIYGTDYSTTDGTCERDYVHISDICNAYLLGIRAILLKSNIKEICNICAGNPISVQNIVSRWNNIKQLNITLGERRTGDPEVVYGDNSKAINLLGWNSTLEIDNIIKSLVK